MQVSAGIAIIWNQKILLTHPTKAPMFETWSIPKGAIEENETIKEAALRETREEVGICIDPDQIINEPILVEYTNKTNIIFKKVYIYFYYIKSLSEISLKHDIVLASQLQRKEVDIALFFDKESAKDYIFWRYRAILNKL